MSKEFSIAYSYYRIDKVNRLAFDDFARVMTTTYSRQAEAWARERLGAVRELSEQWINIQIRRFIPHPGRVRSE